MAAGSDQARQMREWIKEVRKAGYTVTEERLLYKIRDAETGGLIMTAPMYPKGHHVVRNTQSMARKKGVVMQVEEPQRERVGEAPPPPVSEQPAEHQAMAAEIEQRREEHERKETVVGTGRPPASPEQIAATKRIGARLQAAAEAMGGDIDENLLTIWKHGAEIAERNEAWFPGNRSEDQEGRALKHMRYLTRGEYTSLNTHQMEFWTNTMDEWESSREGAAAAAAEASGEVVVSSEFIEAQKTIGAQQKEIESLNADVRELSKRVHARETEVAQLNASITRITQQRDAANQQLAELDQEFVQYKERQAIEAISYNGAVSDELSVTVLRRMLLMKFPNDEEAITEAIEFAAEVARRT